MLSILARLNLFFGKGLMTLRENANENIAEKEKTAWQPLDLFSPLRWPSGWSVCLVSGRSWVRSSTATDRSL